MRRGKRELILVLGTPDSGKTVLMVRITDWLVQHRDSLDSIFVMDRTEEWSVGLEPYEFDLEAQLELLEADDAAARRGEPRDYMGPLVHSVDEFHTFCELLGQANDLDAPKVPRRVVWRMGDLCESYRPGMAEAVAQGNVMIVLPEGPRWFPSIGKHEWPVMEITEGVTLEQVYSEGRAHIKNRDGKRCAISVLTESQFLQQVHWIVRNYSRTVVCSQIEGADTADLIRRNFGKAGRGKELLEEVQKLEPREWIAIRGEMPELAEFRGGGRP